MQSNKKSFHHFTCNKPIGNRFLLLPETGSSRIFWVIFLSGPYTIKRRIFRNSLSHLFCILYWSGVESNTTKMCTNYLITHGLKHKASRNKFYCRRISINSFILFFESYSIQEHILTHEGSYQLLYYTFLDFCSNHEQILMFHHLLE